MDAIYSLLDKEASTPEYAAKMLHPIPDVPVVMRGQWIVEQCRGKVVVNFGSDSGSLHGRIKEVASTAFGVDKSGNPDLRIDLDDDFYSLYHMPAANIYVVGEIIEHLISPGAFLKRLRWIMRHEGAEGCEAIITVPNGMSSMVSYHAMRGMENVNSDHVAWYSYHTLKVLIEKCGFELKEFYWYNGKPVIAEGLIFVVR